MKLNLIRLVIFSWAFIVFAAKADNPPNSFSSGEVIDAERLNENFTFLSEKLNALPRVSANRIYEFVEVGTTRSFISFTNNFGKVIRIERYIGETSGCNLLIDGINLRGESNSWSKFVIPIQESQTITFDCQRFNRNVNVALIVSHLGS